MIPWLKLFDKLGGWGGLFTAIGVGIIVIGAAVAIALSFILGTDVTDTELISRIVLSVTLVAGSLVTDHRSLLYFTLLMLAPRAVSFFSMDW